jgi:dTDP-4-dehydrorhamnose reductase
MKLLIVGASGEIGNAILKKNMNQFDLIPFYFNRKINNGIKFDLCSQTIGEVFSVLRPDDVVVLLSAKTNQRWVYENSAAAKKINVDSIKKVSSEIANHGAFIIYLSSEAVFGEDSELGWLEEDNACPRTEYGRQKAEVEKYILNLEKSTIVRTGWNVSEGSSKICVVKDAYMKMLGDGAKMAIDSKLTITNIEDTATGLLTLANDKSQGIYHFVNSPAVTRYEMARLIYKHSKRKAAMKFEAITFDALKFIEPRSANSYIRAGNISKKIVRDFQSVENVIRVRVNFLDSQPLDLLNAKVL